MVVFVVAKTVHSRWSGNEQYRKFQEFLTASQYEIHRNRLLEKFYRRLICVAPFAILFGIAAFTYWVASIVFAIQSLIIGSKHITSEDDCDHVIGMWLTVFGSLGISSLFIDVFLRNKFEAEPRTPFAFLEAFINFTQLGVLIYGLFILYNWNHEGCTHSLWETFYIIENTLFYGGLGLTILAIALFYSIFPMFLEIIKESTDETRSLLNSNINQRTFSDELEEAITRTEIEDF